ncbi:MAG: hypothetical protein OXD44_10165 [Gammaproteobacteria bacterium]|nr:hypothetical protein [Gammaproteobacteria bacterium]MCY4227057.1 hypothetical protein [Gammaproteobacteria bacterium]MCY4314034.1 hypothetical protein [Gammaproteobacteria bacterium]
MMRSHPGVILEGELEQQGLDLASFTIGQLAAALVHDGSPLLLTLTWRLSSAC